MYEQNKQLLLKALCGYFPYGLKVSEYFEESKIWTNPRDFEDVGPYYILKHPERCKPYLRPMSSMTEEEKLWYESLRNALTYQENGEYDLDDFNELNDFLNRRKLDRYGLIDKGLALEAPDGMYGF